LRCPLLLALCLAAGPVPAQPAQPLTVEDAVSQALKLSPRVAGALRQVSAAREAVRGARALANPQIVLAPALTAAGSDEEVLVQQPLEVNGARGARAAVALARLRRTEAEALKTLREVVFAVKSSYYELARARGRLSLARDLLEDAVQIDQAAARQVEIGARAGIDRTQTAIEVARARQQAARAEGEAAAALAALNAAMGRGPGEPVGELIPFTPPPKPSDLEQAIRTALEARSETAEDAALVAEARAEAELARAEGRPDIAPQFRAERITRGVEGVGVGLAITLPLLDHGSRRSRVRQAEETERALLDRASATRNQIRQEAAQAFARLRAAESVAGSFQEGLLDQARRLLDASRVGFQAGATSILALLEAQRSYRAVNMEHIDALAALAQAHVELERALGTAPGQLPRRPK